jgi:hypothetical protein
MGISSTIAAEKHTHSRHFNKPRYELADIFKRYGANYRRRHGLSWQQRKVMWTIANCRTRAMGGHRKKCDTCDYIDSSYNSCRCRHCPKCQGSLRWKWVQARMRELLPIPYYHVVFTLPHLLNNLALYKKEVIYEIFYQAVAGALITFGWDGRHLGALLGFIAVLHTWGNALSYHVHWHFIVTGGGISADEQRWKSLPYRKKFLFPAQAVSSVVCGKFIDLLDHAYRKGKLQFPDDLVCLSHPVAFEHFKADIAAQAWYWYAKKPFAGPERLIKYLGRYTHRVAISNRRIVDIDQGKITFRYKDYRDGNKWKRMCLGCEVFIQRWLWHILPKDFRRIRYGGFLASNFTRHQKIELARRLLGVLHQQAAAPTSTAEAYHGDRDPEAETRCPMCKRGRMIIIETIPRSRFTGEFDTS